MSARQLSVDPIPASCVAFSIYAGMCRSSMGRQLAVNALIQQQLRHMTQYNSLRAVHGLAHGLLACFQICRLQFGTSLCVVSEALNRSSSALRLQCR